MPKHGRRPNLEAELRYLPSDVGKLCIFLVVVANWMAGISCSTLSCAAAVREFKFWKMEFLQPAADFGEDAV